MSQHSCHFFEERVLLDLYHRTTLTDTGCLEWDGKKDRDGYGVIRRDGKHHPVHRYLWCLVHGPLPREMLVCHTCDNPSCISLDHLFVGTDKDNSDDKVRKGRHAYGSRQHLCKLNTEDVLIIKRRLSLGHRIVDIARDYGVQPQTIGSIKYGRSWKHVILP